MWILLFFVCSLYCSRGMALQCLECKDMPNPDACRVVTTCSGSSRCYVEQVVSSGGLVLYNLGCLSTERCKAKRSILKKRQDTVSTSDVVTCLQCCDGNICNVEGCGIKAVSQSQRPPICYTCDKQQDPESCRDISFCDDNHICGLYTVFTVGNEYLWRSQCLPLIQCEHLGSTGNVCVQCCKDDLCNNNCTNDLTTTATATTTTSSTAAAATTTTETASTQHTTTITTAEPHHNLTSTMTTFQTTHTPHAIDRTHVQYSTAGHTVTSSASYHNLTSTKNTFQTTHQTHPLHSLTGNTVTTSISHHSSTHPTTHLIHLTTGHSFSTDSLHTTPPIQGCKNHSLDMCFVLDSSESLGSHGFHNELRFAIEILHKLVMRKTDDIRVCFITLSSDSAVDIHMTYYNASLDHVISSIKYRNGSSNTHIALSELYHEFQFHERPEADKLAIMMIGGKSTNFPYMRHEVSLINAYGIKLFPVGIGDHVDKHELRLISNNTHFLPNIENMHLIHSHMYPAICQ